MWISDHLTCLLRNLCAGQEATVRNRHGATDWFQIRKGVHQGCILTPYYLTYMQSTSCEMLGWMKHKLESTVPGEISITSDMTSLVVQMVKHLPTMWETQVWSLVRKIPWRRKWQPIPISLPGKSHGQRSLVGYSPWGREESGTTERLQFSLSDMQMTPPLWKKVKRN